MPFERPDSVPIGQVWSRFKGREINGQPALMYQIRDIDDSMSKVCLDMMQETFLRDEPTCQGFDINNDLVAIATIRGQWEDLVSKNTSLACFTEVDGQPQDLVGFNIVYVKSRDDEEEDFDEEKSAPWEKFMHILNTAVDVFKHYNVDRYITSSGLTVLPEHRGQNIGAKLIEARIPLAKALGIKATATVFSATSSQVLAAKCGYEILAELDYADMKKQGIDLTGCSSPSAKVMGTRFN